MEYRKEFLDGKGSPCYEGNMARSDRAHTGKLLMEVSLPVLLFSFLSLVVTLVMLIYAIMMNRQGQGGPITLGRSGRPGGEIPKEINERISPSNVMGLFTSLFTEEEVSIVTSLARAYVEDSMAEGVSEGRTGLRNKHQISTESGVPQRVIYEKDGVIERLCSIGIIEQVETDVRPGGQKYKYRLDSKSHVVVCLIERLKGEKYE